MSKRYFAYCLTEDENETEFFETEAEAKAWCNEAISDEQDFDFLDESVMKGGIGYGKISKHTKFTETDNQMNYEDKEEWPYSSDMDFVGVLELKEVD